MDPAPASDPAILVTDPQDINNFLKGHLNKFSKIKSHKEATKQ
jgi:hypothetical protein